MIGIEDRVKISPATWPAKANVAPGDLSKYAPIGLGMSAPMVMMPYDSLSGMLGRGSFYGANERTGDPIRDAPVNDSSGGVIYFNRNPDPKQLAAVFDLLDVRPRITGYAVYAAESANPGADRYLAQIRIVSYDAMNLFGAVPDPGDAPAAQPISAGDLIAAFIEAQQAAYGDDSSKLDGVLGGDGDWAFERLSFGFMVENAYNCVYRLWSRPWLLTK